MAGSSRITPSWSGPKRRGSDARSERWAAIGTEVRGLSSRASTGRAGISRAVTRSTSTARCETLANAKAKRCSLGREFRERLPAVRQRPGAKHWRMRRQSGAHWGGNFESGYPQYVNGPVRNIGECEGKAVLIGARSKKQLLPKKISKCRRNAKKACDKGEWDCLAEENAKCKAKGVKFHDPELSHDPNSADYCPCCMDYYQMKSGNLFEEDEIELR